MCHRMVVMDLQLGGWEEKQSLVLLDSCGSDHAIRSRFNFLAGGGSLPRADAEGVFFARRA